MKLRKIFSLAINLLAVIFSMIGFGLIARDITPLSYIKFFTILTNVLIIVFGLVTCGYSVDSLLKKDSDVTMPKVVFIFKLITAVSALVTFLTVVTFLQKTVYNDPKNPLPLAMHANNIMHHYLAPLTFVVGFVFFDLDKKYHWVNFFYGALLVVVYAAYAIPVSNISACQSWWGEPPYVFLDLSKVGNWAFLLIPAFIIGALGISFVLWLLNRIAYLIFIGDEIKQEEVEETPEEKAIEAKVQVTEADEAAIAEELKKPHAGPRIYHISKREDKMWQVKFANGKRAIKLFNTQAEAIVFAKKLAKSQLGSIRIHSLKGRIRKSR